LAHLLRTSPAAGGRTNAGFSKLARYRYKQHRGHSCALHLPTCARLARYRHRTIYAAAPRAAWAAQPLIRTRVTVEGKISLTSSRIRLARCGLQTSVATTRAALRARTPSPTTPAWLLPCGRACASTAASLLSTPRPSRQTTWALVADNRDAIVAYGVG